MNEKHLVIVGCGKAKLGHPAAAKDLYTGNLFQASRRYAEAFGSYWVIASAKHGIVDPDTILTPYDQRLDGSGRDVLDAWGYVCQSCLTMVYRRMGIEIEMGRWIDAPQVTILAGEFYASQLIRTTFLRSYPVSTPLAGMQIGQRLQWLNRQLGETMQANERDRA